MKEPNAFEAFLEDFLEKEDIREEQEPAEEPQKDTAEEKEPEPGPHNPFKFLDAYTAEDREIFFGRDLEIAELYHQAFSHKVTVVFGNSGTGKTSLVQCGLFSRIRPEKAAFFLIRSGMDPFASLKNDCIEKIITYDDKSDLYENLASASGTVKKTLFLFFDQFEEIFILQSVETRKNMAVLLKKIIASDLDIKIILGIREEYFARLIEFERVVPDILSNRIWVRSMSRMQVESVIVSPCRVCGVAIDPDVPGQVITELSQGREGMELPYVQVVMDRLYRRAMERDPRQPHIKAQDFQTQGGVKNILSAFIEEQIADMPEEETARQVLKSLITAEGTKRIADMAGISDTAENYGNRIEPLILREILRKLVFKRILREDPDNGLYELRHDFLAHTIRQWMTGIEQELMEVRQTVENRFREYQQIRNASAPSGSVPGSKPFDRKRLALLDRAALQYIAPYESRLHLKDELTDFMEKSKKEAEKSRKMRMLVLAAALAVFVLTVSALGIFGYAKSVEATRQAAKAEAKAKEAEQKGKEAKERLTEARLNLGFVFTEKAGSAAMNRNFNAARLYALHSLANFDLGKAGEEKANASGILLSCPDCPQIFVSPADAHHQGAVNTLAFSPDGKMLASGSDDKTIRIWDVEGGKEKTVLTGHSEPVRTLDFSSDGRFLASGAGARSSSDHSIRLWDAESGKEKAQLTGHGDSVMCVHFSPDGKTLASGSWDKTIRLWDMETLQEKMRFTGHEAAVLSVSFSPDGKTLASGSWDKIIRVWDAETGKERAQLKGHEGPVPVLCFSSDGKTLASGSWDKSIRLWDMETLKEKGVMRKEHASFVSSLHFSPDGKTLVSGGSDSTIRLWDAETGKEKAVLNGYRDAVVTAVFSPDGRILASGAGRSFSASSFSADNAIRLWDAEIIKERNVLTGHADALSSVHFSPDGKTLASGAGSWRNSADNAIRLWDTETGKEKERLTGHADAVRTVRFSPDGKTLVSGSSDKSIRVWDAETGKEKAVLNGHGEAVTSISFSPDGKILASGSGARPSPSSASADSSIRLWDMESGKEKALLGRYPFPVLAVCFSPDGKILASGGGSIGRDSPDNGIRLWDVKSGKEMTVLKGHAKAVTSLDFSPDGKMLASGSSDNDIRLWNIDTATGAAGERAVLKGHAKAVLSVSFSPDGRMLASASFDNSIRVWDAETGKEKAVLDRHMEPVMSVRFSPDGKTLASGSWDKSICLWDLSRLHDLRSLGEQITEAEERYHLKLVKMELLPVEPSKEFHPPRWPKTHPFHWLAKAESGNADAMTELGIIYDRDNELDKAYHWYSKAITAGSQRAEERMKIFRQWLTLHKEKYPEAYGKYCPEP
ncbi:MAG: hypothetical protein R2941_07210 [Desulfobacterales bacterium]